MIRNALGPRHLTLRALRSDDPGAPGAPRRDSPRTGEETGR
ncbi:hypothetical protein [Streptomyces sp. NPDC101132]